MCNRIGVIGMALFVLSSLVGLGVPIAYVITGNGHVIVPVWFLITVPIGIIASGVMVALSHPNG